MAMNGWTMTMTMTCMRASESQEDEGTRRSNALTLRLCAYASLNLSQTQLPDAGRRVDPLEAERLAWDITFELLQPPPGPVWRQLRGRSWVSLLCERQWRRGHIALTQPLWRKTGQQRLAVREQPDGRGPREPERRGARRARGESQDAQGCQCRAEPSLPCLLCVSLNLAHADTVAPPQITISIGNEVRDSTKMLNGMVSATVTRQCTAISIVAEVWSRIFAMQNDTFDSTSGFLGGTFRRMNNMAARQGGRWWYCGSAALADSSSALA